MANAEIESFQGLWVGGYFEGNPLDPMSQSSYTQIDKFNGYADQHALASEKGIAPKQISVLSTLHVTYLMCIRNRVRGKTVLEIGPGAGAWSNCLLQEGAACLYALDAVSAEDNNFFSNVSSNGEAIKRVKYFKVEDFSCSNVQNHSIDFFFSYGCFCHLSRDATQEYFKSIANKMKPGSEGFVMISDYEKLSTALHIDESAKEYDRPRPGRFYNLGTDWFAAMIESQGFTVIDKDIGSNLRDPVVHFKRTAQRRPGSWAGLLPARRRHLS
jgi:hypothetical protein